MKKDSSPKSLPNAAPVGITPLSNQTLKRRTDSSGDAQTLNIPIYPYELTLF
ncbi:Hypothetical protein FKW44_024125 [Caligus rogercresseyi]|uniref:Uncharacterized protein n=1 Tax=Caligus rogercresseyi TaxID=217165 RepID=A0A7T8JT71_CALRO|nr:Hypothetical protein FKW44_024869 [Caligus rogercresseyi]QQP32930.1 Hypothetical protein FKW44_024125 [Caligus rogercresseyi]